MAAAAEAGGPNPEAQEAAQEVGQVAEPPLPSPNSTLSRADAMAQALATPLKASPAAASAAAAGPVSGGKGGPPPQVEGLEGGGFAYLRTTARASRNLCGVLLQLMQVGWARREGKEGWDGLLAGRGRGFISVPPRVIYADPGLGGH